MPHLSLAMQALQVLFAKSTTEIDIIGKKASHSVLSRSSHDIKSDFGVTKKSVIMKSQPIPRSFRAISDDKLAPAFRMHSTRIFTPLVPLRFFLSELQHDTFEVMGAILKLVQLSEGC